MYSNKRVLQDKLYFCILQVFLIIKSQNGLEKKGKKKYILHNRIKLWFSSFSLFKKKCTLKVFSIALCFNFTYRITDDFDSKK